MGIDVRIAAQYEGCNVRLYGPNASVDQGTWAYASSANILNQNYWNNSATKAQNDAITWTRFLPKGKYKVYMIYHTGNDRGILRVKIGPSGGSLTTRLEQDAYAAASAYNSDVLGAEFTNDTSQDVDIQLISETKNGASGGYWQMFSEIVLMQTGVV